MSGSALIIVPFCTLHSSQVCECQLRREWAAILSIVNLDTGVIHLLNKVMTRAQT